MSRADLELELTALRSDIALLTSTLWTICWTSLLRRLSR